MHSSAQIEALSGLDRNQQLLNQRFLITVRRQLEQVEARARSWQSTLVRRVAHMPPHVDGDRRMQMLEAEKRWPACTLCLSSVLPVLPQRSTSLQNNRSTYPLSSSLDGRVEI